MVILRKYFQQKGYQVDETLLKAQTREITGKKVRQIRESGMLPVVLYGHGIEPKSLSVDAKEFARAFAHSGSSTMVKIIIDDNTEPINILFHQIDRNPVSGDYVHADFLQVKLTEKIKTEIPIVLEGEENAPVVKEKEGSIITNKDHIEVEAFPQDLIHEIVVNVSELAEFDQVIHVKDLIVPAKIDVLDDPDDVIVSIQEPRSEEELAKLEQEVVEDVEAVEVEKKGKEEDEDSTESADGASGEQKEEKEADK